MNFVLQIFALKKFNVKFFFFFANIYVRLWQLRSQIKGYDRLFKQKNSRKLKKSMMMNMKKWIKFGTGEPMAKLL